MCISKELCSKGTYILAPEFSHISQIQMFTLEREWPKNQKATILICKTLYQSSNFSNTVKNFKTEKLKEYYSEHPYTYHLESTTNILLCEHYHTSISLPTHAIKWCFFGGGGHTAWHARLGIKPVPPEVEACSLNHWTARKVPKWCFLKSAAGITTYYL